MDNRFVVVDDLMDRIIDEQETGLAAEQTAAIDTAAVNTAGGNTTAGDTAGIRTAPRTPEWSWPERLPRGA